MTTCDTRSRHLSFFSFNDPATTEIYTLSLHDALPIYTTPKEAPAVEKAAAAQSGEPPRWGKGTENPEDGRFLEGPQTRDRKSTRLNSSHSQISYAVFCLKKKKKKKKKVNTNKRNNEGI